MSVPKEHRLSVALLTGLIAAAWISIIAWSRSSHAQLLSHDALGQIAWDRAWIVPVLLGGWTLMAAAMMLPAFAPALMRHGRGRLSGARTAADAAMMVAGYLFVWSAAGAVLLAADLILHRAAGNASVAPATTLVLVPGTVALAGVWQMTSVRARCLSRIVAQGCYVGSIVHQSGLGAGFRHGIYCAGASWPLMLLMFAAGHGNLSWMLLFGGVMTVERVSGWGRQLGPSLGPALLCAAAGLLILGIAS